MKEGCFPQRHESLYNCSRYLIPGAVIRCHAKNSYKLFLLHPSHGTFLDPGNREGHVQVNNIVTSVDCTPLIFAPALLEGAPTLKLP